MSGTAVLPGFRFPAPKNGKGGEFTETEAFIDHLANEPSGFWLIGSQGMWHGGIHLSDATTKWCALSGTDPREQAAYPQPYGGEQPLRCMANGEIAAYRINRQYAGVSWMRAQSSSYNGHLACSASFLLLRHYIQPGPTGRSGLRFYTLYMGLAPWSAYMRQQKYWQVAEPRGLAAYADRELLFRVSVLPKGTQIIWDKDDATRVITDLNKRRFGYVTLANDVHAIPALSTGDTVWILVDKNNITSLDAVPPPGWWEKLGQEIAFDRVIVPPTPVCIKLNAGAPIGHLGFMQKPLEYGVHSCYETHIECFSADDNLPAFLNNPEGVGDDNPMYMRYQPGRTLFIPGTKPGQWRDTERKTQGTGIVAFKNNSSDRVKNGTRYYKISAEGGFLKAKDVELVSQYNLAKQGFSLAQDCPESFDLINGRKQPLNITRAVLERLYETAKRETCVSYRLAYWNYQRLKRKIDSGDSFYDYKEYVRTIHVRRYRDTLNRIIVKHPSEWYYGKDDALWKTYLDTLKEAPLWRQYGESFLSQVMGWMKQVPELTAELWHMHPVVFISALAKKKTGWAQSPFAELLGKVESNNDYTAYNVTKKGKVFPFYNTSLTSMTLGEVMRKQDDREMFATGRFQIITPTLLEAKTRLNLDKNEFYDEAMQDRIFEDYLIKIKRPAIIKYLEGDGDIEDAIYDWAKEFASAGVRKGKKISPGKVKRFDNEGNALKDKSGNILYKIGPRCAPFEGASYYHGDGLNKAHLMPSDMVSALIESKKCN